LIYASWRNKADDISKGFLMGLAVAVPLSYMSLLIRASLLTLYYKKSVQQTVVRSFYSKIYPSSKLLLQSGGILLSGLGGRVLS
jgi:hypothetical protein